MIYITKTQRLYTDDGKFIKEVNCPLSSQLARTVSAAEPDRTFRCMHCSTEVKNLAYLSDEEAHEATRQNADVCFFATSAAKNVVHISDPTYRFYLRHPLIREKLSGDAPTPLVRTARTIEEMNFAAANGYRVLVRRTGSGQDLRTAVGVYRDNRSGALHLCGDYRIASAINWQSSNDNPARRTEVKEEFVLPMFSYCPQGPDSPVAAYLIPLELPANTEVFVEDIIEDVVKDYPQGSRVRAAYCFATWTGDDLILSDPVDEGPVLG